jgi:hypothetical protein
MLYSAGSFLSLTIFIIETVIFKKCESNATTRQTGVSPRPGGQYCQHDSEVFRLNNIRLSVHAYTHVPVRITITFFREILIVKVDNFIVFRKMNK